MPTNLSNDWIFRLLLRHRHGLILLGNIGDEPRVDAPTRTTGSDHHPAEGPLIATSGHNSR